MTLETWIRETETADNVFARRIGVSRVTLYRFKTGHRIPNRATMAKIVEATSGAVTPDSFFNLSAPSPDLKPEVAA